MTQNKGELLDLAQKMNIEVDGRWSAENIAAAIHAGSQPKAAPAQAPERPVHINTVADVRAAIKPIMDAKPGFEAIFDDESWTFRFSGAEDSGNLNIPLRLIKIKAESVAKGRRSPRGFKDGKDVVLWA